MLHLKPDDVPPAVPGKEPVGVGRGQPEFPEVVVDGELNAFEGAGHINGAGLVEQLVDAGVLCGVVRAVDCRGLLFFVRFPGLFHGEYGQHEPFFIGQGHGLAGGERFGQGPVHVEADGDGPEGAVGQAHVLKT